MKVVASRDFLNVNGLSFSDFTDADGKSLTPHKNHVPKGARFEIGKGIDIVEDLSAGDKLKLVQLLPTGGANCIVYAKDKDTVAKIDKEVTLIAKHKAAEKAAQPPTNADLLSRLDKLAGTVDTLLQALAAAKPVKV